MTAGQGDLEARVERLEKLLEDLIKALYAGIVADNPDLALAAIHDDLGLVED